MCRLGSLLNFKNEEYVVFYLLSGQGPASSIIPHLWSFCYYGIPVHRGKTVQPGARLSHSLPGCNAATQLDSVLYVPLILRTDFSDIALNTLYHECLSMASLDGNLLANKA